LKDAGAESGLPDRSANLVRADSEGVIANPNAALNDAYCLDGREFLKDTLDSRFRFGAIHVVDHQVEFFRRRGTGVCGVLISHWVRYEISGLNHR
jgi:hypothetical protein